MENHMNKWMIWGFFPLFLETPIYVYTYVHLFSLVSLYGPDNQGMPHVEIITLTFASEAFVFARPWQEDEAGSQLGIWKQSFRYQSPNVCDEILEYFLWICMIFN